jgi:hypothetical protein
MEKKLLKQQKKKYKIKKQNRKSVPSEVTPISEKNETYTRAYLDQYEY